MTTDMRVRGMVRVMVLPVVALAASGLLWLINALWPLPYVFGHWLFSLGCPPPLARLAELAFAIPIYGLLLVGPFFIFQVYVLAVDSIKRDPSQRL